MNYESDRDFAAENYLERLADELAGFHGLAERTWETADERRETLWQIARTAAQARGLSEEAEELLRDFLGDRTALAIEHRRRA